MPNIDTAAIESLRAFALRALLLGCVRADAQIRLDAFVRLCTAALVGEVWAVERLAPVLTVFTVERTQDARPRKRLLAVILATDCTQPVMSKNIDTPAIESLRAFAMCHIPSVPQNDARRDHLRAFGDMCTAAVQGEEWAIARVMNVVFDLALVPRSRERLLALILATDCTRPEGA